MQSPKARWVLELGWHSEDEIFLECGMWSNEISTTCYRSIQCSQSQLTWLMQVLQFQRDRRYLRNKHIQANLRYNTMVMYRHGINLSQSIFSTHKSQIFSWSRKNWSFEIWREGSCPIHICTIWRMNSNVLEDGICMFRNFYIHA